MCLHSDACLGGFVLPFARTLGYDIPPFDFGVPGYGCFLHHSCPSCYCTCTILLWCAAELFACLIGTTYVWPGGQRPGMQMLIGPASGCAEKHKAQAACCLHGSPVLVRCTCRLACHQPSLACEGHADLLSWVTHHLYMARLRNSRPSSWKRLPRIAGACLV